MPLVAYEDDLLCPITHEPFEDPVATVDGHIYERKEIETWLKNNNTSPLTNLILERKEVIPIIHIKKQMEQFRIKNNVIPKNIFYSLLFEGSIESIDKLDKSGYIASYLTNPYGNNECIFFQPLPVSSLKWLISRGIDVNCLDIEGVNKLHYRNSIEQLTFLFELGCDARVRDMDGCTILHTVNTTLDLVKLICEKAPHLLNVCDHYGRTPLFSHVEVGNADIITYLCEKGADKKIHDCKKDTCLHEACRTNDIKICKLLLEIGGFDLEARNNEGFTCLMRAIGLGHVEIVRLLLQKGASLLTTGEYGDSPLSYALCSEKSSVEMVEFLIPLVDVNQVLIIKGQKSSALIQFITTFDDGKKDRQLLDTLLKSNISNIQDALKYAINPFLLEKLLNALDNSAHKELEIITLGSDDIERVRVVAKHLLKKRKCQEEDEIVIKKSKVL